ncbi:alpha/beta fold hydrolase [Sutcliffiella rhizosphaerae]|uniref:AB hydrolase-1 domain-containing protein n=1 Tax=Sutcliffiella rhizosphaerae TaxID=2880967 RepID=A0ABM8YN15_9BACI|nr:alpha/beta hydrolase [Sutcliffiella rhizosphaerae]CAG9621271.1 hypothetical protein BACCIP111883_02043 [Sutcliffiella rhizosphaerae]
MKLLSRKPDFFIPETGISSIEPVILGGIEQYILLQAEDPTNPVLLFLHGGPAMPLPGVSNMGVDYTVATNTKELVKNFILVFWDQRGTGKSYNKKIKQETMTIQQFVTDANELVDYLRGKFSQEKIFLVGHSWGTLLGLSLVNQYPNKFYSYVGISQLINWSKNDELMLNWAKDEATKRNNKRALKELTAIGNPPFIESTKQWITLRKWAQRFGSLIYIDEEIKYPGMLTAIKSLFQSKDYSLIDVYQTFTKSMKLIYNLDFIKTIATVNFKEQIPKVSLPVTFLHGSKDVHIFGELVQDYFKILEAKEGKQFISLDKSAHFFHPEDSKNIEQKIIEELKYYRKK